MTTKQIFLLGLILLSQASQAADNSIFIDQAGDNATITMLQDGASNRIRAIQGTGTGNTTPSRLRGDALVLSIQQIGSGNILNMGVDTSTANGFSPTNVSYKVQGNNAVATIDINGNGLGTASSQILNIDQDGSGALATINMLGSNNSLTAIQAGGANNSLTAVINANDVLATINQTGGGANATVLNMTGDKGQVDIITVGALNSTTITQSGGATIGHYAKVDITGSSNTTVINQSGTVDSTINLKSVGNGNVTTLTSRN
jgi:hypothetical protein